MEVHHEMLGESTVRFLLLDIEVEYLGNCDNLVGSTRQEYSQLGNFFFQESSSRSDQQVDFNT